MALTTHIGSLPRLDKLLDILKAKYGGQPYDEAELNSILTQEVADCVRKQVECSIEIVTDGEYSKPGFFTYIRERFDGYESRPEQKLVLFQKEVSSFPEYYARYFKEAMMGGAILPIVPVVCTGADKIQGRGETADRYRQCEGRLPGRWGPRPSCVFAGHRVLGRCINEYYKSDEEYFHALATELNKEYRAIVAAGILVQVDDPFLPDIFVEPGLDDKQKKRRAEIYIEATNVALSGIPAERVRFHTCYGINEGPRIYESNLPEIIEYVLKINAGSFSFEAANPRHEREYHLFDHLIGECVSTLWHSFVRGSRQPILLKSILHLSNKLRGK